MLTTLSRLTQGIFYIYAGSNHFRNREFYMRIIPPILPFHDWINTMCGITEITLGIFMLIPRYSKAAAEAIMVLLVAVFPANIYHYTSGGAGMKIPSWLLFLRLPFQLVFLMWANAFRK